MIKAIFLDMDDTLIVNQTLYERAEILLYGYLRCCGILEKDAQKMFAAIDKELFKIHGVSKKRMPASFEAVLRHFVPGADDEMVSIVRGFAENIFTAKAALKPGTAEAIALLKQHGYDLYIVTAGDRDVQEGRIASSVPFKDDISGVFIVDKKSSETYAEIIKQLGLNPSETVMMGDSLKSDVIPSAAAGMHAVWIEAHNSPLHETATGFPAQGAAKFSSLLEAARHIIRHGTPAAPLVLPPPAPRNKKAPPPPSP